MTVESAATPANQPAPTETEAQPPPTPVVEPGAINPGRSSGGAVKQPGASPPSGQRAAGPGPAGGKTGAGAASPSAQAAASGSDFNRAAALTSLNAVAAKASNCRKGEEPPGTAKVSVTFAPSGQVTVAAITGPLYAGTSTGGCIAGMFRSASVPPFSGSPATVTTSVTVR